ncbi:caspase family protein [Algimonas porphyrae]|uniref:Caspase domain-containing protein n=1 Tax=Algimonas porphyrae TaxID=1128113 RepID=A0ABQ5V6A5_9PROT|nr:caspase family protein [Algimonas porphyrae]GLQ21802.1 hypothetical protein GCM10007854_27570 [Algimonas porphyrae]
MIRDKSLIIIAVSDYKGSGTYGDLPGAITSAKNMQAWFEDGGPDRDYRVLSITDEQGEDVTVDRINREVKAFLEGDFIDRIIVYFVGHGLMHGYERFWLLSNYDQNPGQCLSVSQCLKVLKTYNIGKHNTDLESGQICIISDACSNIGTSTHFPVGNPITSKGGGSTDYAEVDLFYSSKGGDFSLHVDDPDENGGVPYTLFTHHFLKGLSGDALSSFDHPKGTVVTSQSLARYITRTFSSQSEGLTADVRAEVLPGFYLDNDFYYRLPAQTSVPPSTTDGLDHDSLDSGISLPSVSDDPAIFEDQVPGLSIPTDGFGQIPIFDQPDDATGAPVHQTDEFDDDEDDLEWEMDSDAVQIEPGFADYVDRFSPSFNDFMEKASSDFFQVRNPGGGDPYAVRCMFGLTDEKPRSLRVLNDGVFDWSPFIAPSDTNMLMLQPDRERYCDHTVFYQMQDRWLLMPQFPRTIACVHDDYPLDIFYYLQWEYYWDYSAVDALNNNPPSSATLIRALSNMIEDDEEGSLYDLTRIGYLYDRNNDVDNILRTVHHIIHDSNFDLIQRIPFDLAALSASRITIENENGHYKAYADFPAVAAISDQRREQLEDFLRPRQAVSDSALEPLERVPLWGIMPAFSAGWRNMDYRDTLDLPDIYRQLIPEVGHRTTTNMSQRGMDMLCERFGMYALTLNPSA